MTTTNAEKAEVTYSRPIRSFKKIYNGWITQARTIATINGTVITNKLPNGSGTWPKKNPITKIKPTVKMPMANLMMMFNASALTYSCLIWKILGKLLLSRFGRGGLLSLIVDLNFDSLGALSYAMRIFFYSYLSAYYESHNFIYWYNPLYVKLVWK